MHEIPIPAEAHGDWIWKADCLEETDSYVFMRREFALEEIPTSAELWLSVRGNYHVFINGRHLSRGPAPAPVNTSYIQYHDIAHCLWDGRNPIAFALVCLLLVVIAVGEIWLFKRKHWM